MTQKFKEFRLGDVFDVRYVNRVKSTKKGHNYMYDTDVISEDGKYPYICAISTKNGVKGYSNIEPNNEGDCITLSTTADSSATVFYQPFPFIGRQQIAGIRRLDGEPMGERIGLYVATIIRKITKLFNYSYKLTIDWLQNMTIELPVTETGDPDWVYMDRYIQEIEDRYIQEIEDRYIQEIEDYFEVAGIDSIELTDDEKEILQKIPKFHEFRIGDLFEKVNLKRKTSKFDKRKDVSSNWTPEYSLPLVNAKLGDNGVMWWGKKEQWETATQTIDIVKNGVVSTGKVYPQPQETGVLWDAYLIKLIQPVTSSNILMYLSTAIEKAIRLRYTYDYKATWAKVQNDKIKLPIILGGEPDWDYMYKYTEVTKKIAIARYANSEERKIQLAKKILNDKNH